MGEKEFSQAKELELLNKGTWELRDQPISTNVSEAYIDPFTGRPTWTFKRDPRYQALENLLEVSNKDNYTKASIRFNKESRKPENVVILPKWNMLFCHRSEGDLTFVQEPCAYIDICDSFDHINERKFIYRGRIRKELRGKVFIIDKKGKKFYSVKDIGSGKRYKLWPEDLEEVDSEYIIDWSNSKEED